MGQQSEVIVGSIWRQQRRYNNRLIVMFNIIHELVDVQTDVIWTGDSRTRGSNRLYHPVAQKDAYKFFFSPRIIRKWNILPGSVIDADKLEELRGRIQNLPERVNPSTHTSDQSRVHSFSIIYIPENF